MGLEHEFMRQALLAGLCAGIACGIVGVFMVTMHLSFLGVCISHAAFAGALMAIWLGTGPVLGALGFGLGAAAVIGPLADRGQLSPDASTGIVFSLMLGLAFLFLGLTRGARTEALSMLWGSILTVSRSDLAWLAGCAGVVLVGLALFFKEVQAVVCHRDVAAAVGVPATAVFYGMLFATGATVAVSLPAAGGLLVYALLLNPAAAALQVTTRLRWTFAVSAAFGVASCWLGLLASYWWDLLAGACIVLVSVLIFALAAVLSPKRRGMARRHGMARQ